MHERRVTLDLNLRTAIYPFEQRGTGRETEAVQELISGILSGKRNPITVRTAETYMLGQLVAGGIITDLLTYGAADCCIYYIEGEGKGDGKEPRRGLIHQPLDISLIRQYVRASGTTPEFILYKLLINPVIDNTQSPKPSIIAFPGERWTRDEFLELKRLLEKFKKGNLLERYRVYPPYSYTLWLGPNLPANKGAIGLGIADNVATIVPVDDLFSSV